MVRRINIVAILLAVIFITGSVQILDPSIGEKKIHAVNVDDTPEDLAYDAIKQLRDVDYTYKINKTERNTSSGNTTSRKIIEMRLENSEGRYLLLNTISSKERAIKYGNNLMGWAKTESLNDSKGLNNRHNWRRLSSKYKSEVHNPLSPTELRNTDFRVVEETNEYISIRANDTDQILNVIGGTIYLGVHPNDTAEMTMTVDKKQERISSLFVRAEESSRSVVYSYNMTFVDYGETRVQRPEGISYTLEEFVKDLLE